MPSNNAIQKEAVMPHIRAYLRIAVVVCAALTSGAVVRAQSLDTAFNPAPNGRIVRIAVQADGKILVGGSFTALGGGELGISPRSPLARLNADAPGASPTPLAPPLPAQIRPFLRDPSGLSGVTATSGTDRPVTIRVIYDNYVKTEGLTKDWGLSLLIEGLDKRVLFDTGAKADIFASNVKQMKLDLSTVDLLVLSHEHGDHTGGIPAFVTMRRDIPVLMPRWFTDAFKKRMDNAGLTPMLVGGPAKITEHLYSSGEFDFEIPEQALVLDTRDGLVVITGCSHPGIVDMLRTIKTAFKKNISMVIGGFHLLEKTDAEMSAIIGDLKALGVVKCGATHCTGDKQIGMIKEAFGANYVELGVGNAIVVK
jgi:7,8-dihydropterin-6-yl-methyl-4-(beta-D-ribofuranosyl)aminobenzene 5'-phosphate synthase